MKRFTILIGGYGSGKTEISLNLAFKAAAEGRRTVLVDFDIVNPYFRSSERTDLLEEAGIRVIAPCFANKAVDIPSLPPEIYSPFDSDYEAAVYDVGGDPVGAAALGMLKDRIAARRDDVELIYVVNAMRPFQSSADDLQVTFANIQARCGFPVDAILNNANIALETEPEHIAIGDAACRELSGRTGVPYKYIVHSDLVSLPEDIDTRGRDILEIRRYMAVEWLGRL